MISLRSVDLKNEPSFQGAVGSWKDNEWQAAAILKALEIQGTYLIGSYYDQIPAGFVLVRYCGDFVEVFYVYVAEAQRRLGLGLALLNEVCVRATQLGVLRVVLEVRPSNKSALMLYERLGFNKVMTRHRYYADGEAAWVLALEVKKQHGSI